MKNLILEKTKYTLQVHFHTEKGLLEMSGSSYPENAMEFFTPIFDSLAEYISDVKKDLTVNVRIDYLNTSSTKCILDILEILESYHSDDHKVTVNWHYQADDEDILETGEEMAEDINLPIHFFPYER